MVVHFLNKILTLLLIKGIMITHQQAINIRRIRVLQIEVIRQEEQSKVLSQLAILINLSEITLKRSDLRKMKRSIKNSYQKKKWRKRRNKWNRLIAWWGRWTKIRLIESKAAKLIILTINSLKISLHHLLLQRVVWTLTYWKCLNGIKSLNSLKKKHSFRNLHNHKR